MKKSMVTIITIALRWLRTPLHAEKEEGNEDCKGKQENKPLCNGNNLRFPKNNIKLIQIKAVKIFLCIFFLTLK